MTKPPYKSICRNELKCGAHGLRWPCELCEVEQGGLSICTACGLQVASELNPGGLRACEAWVRQEPSYRLQPVRQVGLAQNDQSTLAGDHARAAKAFWLDRIAALGADVDVSTGTIRMPLRPGVDAVALRIRFRSGDMLCLLHPAQVDFWRRFMTLGSATASLIARFDEGTIQWKEPAEPHCGGADDGGTATLVVLNVRAWTDVDGLNLEVLSMAGPGALRRAPSEGEEEPASAEDQVPTEDGLEDAAGELEIERDMTAESESGIAISAATATLQDDSTVLIIGEIEATGGRRIGDYRTLQVLVYDAAGKVWGRDYTNWSEFGRRQSFEVEVSNERSRSTPTRVKLFPTTE